MRYMKLNEYQGRVNNKAQLPEVGEVVRGDTEQHYRQKKNDSQKPYKKSKKGKNQSQKQKDRSQESVGTSFGDLLKGIKL